MPWIKSYENITKCLFCRKLFSSINYECKYRPTMFAYFYCLHIYIKKCRPRKHQTKTEQNRNIASLETNNFNKISPNKKMTFDDAMPYGLSTNFTSNIKRVLINWLNFISPNTLITLINSLMLRNSRNNVQNGLVKFKCVTSTKKQPFVFCYTVIPF